MKKISLIVLSFLFCAIASAQNSYTTNFDIADFTFEKHDGILVISPKEAHCFLEDKQAPAIPYFNKRVLLPSGYKTSDYKVSYEKRLIYENVDIEKNPGIIPTNSQRCFTTSQKADKSSGSPVVFCFNNSRYGYYYSFFKVSPFVYDHEKRNLYFINQIELTLTTKAENKEIISEIRHDKADEIRQVVINASDIERFYTGSAISNYDTRLSLTAEEKNINTGVPDYIIITSNALKDAFEPLLQWKIRKGLKAHIYTLEQISTWYQWSDLTLKEKLKRFLMFSGAKYVLFGGDGSVVPIEYCQIKININGSVTTEDTPCDMFYACYGGSTGNWDWDANGNGKKGEIDDNISLDPVFYVTRAPVSTYDEANNFVQKVIRYERNLMFNDYIGKMLFVGAKLKVNIFGGSDSHYRSESIYNTYINDNWAYGHDYLYDSGGNISGYSSISGTNLRNLINTNYHFIHNDSHGCASYIDYNSYDTYNNTYPDYQSNNGESIFITSACLTNAFDSACVSKAFIGAHHGAVAYFGSSRSGISYDSPFQIGQSLLYDAYFFHRLLTGYPSDAPYRFGAVAAESKKEFADDAFYSDSDGWRYLQLAINPMGDPEMPIYSAIPNSFTNVSINNSVPNQITVSTGDISGCTIALVSIDNGASYFDVAEGVSSYTFTDVMTPCYVTITKHNYKPYAPNNIIYPTYSISGNDFICESNVYTIGDIPTGCTVNWEFVGGESSLNNLIQQNTPSVGKCTISNPNSLYISAMLNATISKDGTTWGVCAKHVSTAGNFSASFVQTGGTIGGGSIVYPNISTTIYDGSHQGVFELCPLTFTSSDFANCTFSFSGFAPSQWNVVGNTVYASFPSAGNSVKYCTVEGRQNTGCKIFRFYLIIIPGSVISNALLNNIDVRMFDSRCVVSISDTSTELDIEGSKQRYDITIPNSWNVSVIDSNTGMIVLQKRAEGSRTEFYTTGWRPGIYIVTCDIDGQSASKKILVK